MGECKLCHAPVCWVRLDTGKALPVDPLPVDPADTRGNVVCRVIGGRLHGWVESRAHPHEPMMLRMIPHHSTCPTYNERRAARSTAPTLFD